MIKRTPDRTNPRAGHRRRLGPGFGLLLVAPIALLALSLTAALLVGCSVAALLLPAVLRKRSPRVDTDENCIVLDPGQYTRLSDDHVRRPRH